MSYGRWNIYSVWERSSQIATYEEVLRAAESAGKNSTGAIFFPANTSPAAATVATQWILECDDIEFSGMVLGNMPAYRGVS